MAWRIEKFDYSSRTTAGENFGYRPIAQREIESRGEKVESRISRFGSLLSPPRLGLLSTLFFRVAVRQRLHSRMLLVSQKSVDFADAFCQQTELISRGYASNSFIRTAKYSQYFRSDLVTGTVQVGCQSPDVGCHWLCQCRVSFDSIKSTGRASGTQSQSQSKMLTKHARRLSALQLAVIRRRS
jgi:hypothetical protein